MKLLDYELIDDKVIYETNGIYSIIYTYDYDGTLISFSYDDDIDDLSVGTEYFYIYNQMGDITHIIDINGEEKVRYIYDAYGNIIDIDAISPYSEIAEANPYRYRGYRYDSEINMYYLNSRYYNPEIGRFINADGLLGELGNIQSTNMYAYCANNPVMYSDLSGYAPEWLKNVGGWFGDHWKEIAIGAAFIVVGATITVLTCGTGAGFVAAFGSALIHSAVQVGVSMAVSVGVGGLISVSQGRAFFDDIGDSLASGFMWGGVFAGGAQILSGGFKFAAQHGFKGFGSFMSPDRLRGATEIANIAKKGQPYYSTGGRLVSFGFGAIDVGTKAMLHGHLWFTSRHLWVGAVSAGIIGGH